MIDLLGRFGPTIYSDPHTCYAALRDEGPVHDVVLPDGRRCHLVLNYSDARRVLSSDSLSNQRPGRGDSHMLESDEPRHSMLRQAVANAFSKSSVRAMRPTISRIVDQQISRLPPDEDVDLVQNFARIIPVLVTGRVLGILPGDEAALRRWTTNILATDDGTQRMGVARAELTQFITEIFERRRPVSHDGLIWALMTGSRKTDITDVDLISTITLLIVAGHEATVNLITNAILSYLEFPDVAGELANGTAHTDDLIAETLRYQSPLSLSANRYLVRDLEVSGKALEGDGALIIASFASANRDGAKYERPDSFLLRRQNSSHLGFGSGTHRCLGNSLAMAEAQCAVGELIRRYPDMSHREETRWRPSCISRSQYSLVVRLEGGALKRVHSPRIRKDDHTMRRSLEIAEKVQAIVLDVLRSSDGAETGNDLDLDADLRGFLGFDSLSIMYVLSTAEEEFGVTLDDEEVIASTVSVRALAACIEKRTTH